MPPVISGNPGAAEGMATQSETRDHGYKYPRGADMRPGSPLHQRILTEIMRRARVSHDEISKRHGKWREIDRSLTAYIRLDDVEQKVKAADERRPVSLVIPVAWATLEVLLSHWAAVAFDNPTFKYIGVGPEDKLGAILLEQLIGVQSSRGKHGLALHTMGRDGFAYGVGAVAPDWTREYGRRTESYSIFEGTPFEALMGGLFKRRRRSEEQVLFEGHRLRNINPYNLLPDPTVSIENFQDGEFFGYLATESYHGLLDLERRGEDGLFNVKYLSGVNCRSSLRPDVEKEGRLGPSQNPTDDNVTRRVDTIHMYLTIIPKEWELGDFEYPEKWKFTVAGDKYVIQARPLDLDHGRYPIALLAPDTDGYSLSPVSRIEMVEGLQNYLNWMMSSHITNVRRVLNDMVVVDPSRVEMQDLLNPKPGKILRLKQSAWGKPIDEAIKQLNVQDVTRQHVQESPFILDLIQMVAGTSDAPRSQRGASDRVTSQEIQAQMMKEGGRNEKTMRMMEMQAIWDLGYLMAKQTQQLMSMETYVGVSGRWEDTLRDEFGMIGDQMPVTPFDLLCEFDVTPGSVAARDGLVQPLLQLAGLIMQNQEAAMQFDIVRLIKGVARRMGETNISDFIRKAPQMNIQMATPEQLAQESQAGNIVPLDAGGAAGA
jgi:hypothetical protein